MDKKSVFRGIVTSPITYSAAIVILFFIEHNVGFKFGVIYIVVALMFGAVVGFMGYVIFPDSSEEKEGAIASPSTGEAREESDGND